MSGIKKVSLNCTVPTMTHVAGSVMVWRSMSAGGVDNLVFVNGILNKEVYIKILKDNSWVSGQRSSTK